MTSATNPDGEDFSFNGMFHTCANGFNWDMEANISRDDQELTLLCSKFQNAVNNGGYNNINFIKYCRVLCSYLKYIVRNIEENNEKNCCKLFYYKLKNDIIHKFSINEYSEAKDFYNKMVEQNIYSPRTKISDICMSHPEHIKQETSNIFEYLFNIYYYKDLLNGRKIGETGTMRQFKKKIEHLENFYNNNKDRLKEELQKIIEICKDFKNRWTTHPYKHAAAILSDSWLLERKRKLEEKDEKTIRNIGKQTKTLEKKLIDPQAFMNTETDNVTNTGISIGKFFITFSILIILFILYKYTPYFSFLKPRIRKLRRKMNKNNKNNLGLMETFDFEYNNSIDDRYKIAYS
ncbi:variable surface protein [Plasmodium gonderi]|uniref:Variable surface protein n=1 Tax=Plasmodium gonderi TaxID=77519 RepID=A0A1Y1JNY3_PLAGO|nr:variable surface protein [Plasmodium gonderi]GAW84179.1 variable surface protein [Plasmodium gonderi]